MIRAVLDTNVLASGFVRLFEPRRPASIPASLILAWADGQFTLIASETLLTELDRAWRRAYFRSRLAPVDADALLNMLREDAVMVEPASDVQGIAAHPSDDPILATAVAGHAGYVVTGDRAFRRLGIFRGTRLISPPGIPRHPAR